MGLVQRIGNALGSRTRLGRRVRATREWSLNRWYGNAGLPRTVNGIRLRVLPRYRWYFQPEYDAPVAAYLRRRVRPGMICVSIGANLGMYPLQLAAWSGPKGIIYAFEPNPVTVEALIAHVRMNDLAERVRIVPVALGDRSGTATFYATGVDGMSRLGNPNPALRETVPIQVSIETLDNFFAREQVSPDVLVADVEGFEAAVLRGGRGLFRSATPPITVVEMHPSAWVDTGIDRDRFAAILDELRLRIVPLSGQVDPMAEYGHVALEPTSG